MEYPKIETLFTRDEKTFKVIPTELRNKCYSLIKFWEFTEKIDGTNIRIMWDGQKLTFGGRTDKADIPAPLVQHLMETVSIEKLQEKFGDTDVIIYGEGYGGKIQKGSFYSKEQKFIVFDILVDRKWWLSWENIVDISDFLGLKTVPYAGTMTLEEGVELVRRGFNSVLALEQTGEKRLAEGVVGRTAETLYDKRGRRLIIKLKTKDF